MLGTKGQPYYQDDNDGEAVMYDQSVPLVPIMPQTPQYKPTHLGPPLPDPSTTGVFSRIFGGFKRVRASSENVRNAEVAQSSAAPRRSSHQSQSTYTDVGPIKTEAPFYPATGLGVIKDGRMHTALTQGDRFSATKDRWVGSPIIMSSGFNFPDIACTSPETSFFFHGILSPSLIPCMVPFLILRFGSVRFCLPKCPTLLFRVLAPPEPQPPSALIVPHGWAGGFGGCGFAAFFRFPFKEVPFGNHSAPRPARGRVTSPHAPVVGLPHPPSFSQGS
uniref:Uncharacterized protein n=1 Tax=Heterosigma akashiwo TaxID=2829 RepID=A0A7S3XUH5_HETAK|mmetsp:Transcript_23366/g.40089  ORF Transcript_23366/g.40089 Transcript_23366/m.40089 type:complete len:276 (+) Transcript_23366:234-1061(+)